ncbi:serine hydrolase domain-containing protein [Nocardia sp. NPDC020380]|uniref:serine hydrolase domain-containing protein n=1 Tax=Nocardia sp. NPDC020380 TaxID=3364309 RepID=UPI003787FBC8
MFHLDSPPSIVPGIGGPIVAEPAPVPTPVEILCKGAQSGVGAGYPGVIGLIRKGSNTDYVEVGCKKFQTTAPVERTSKFRIGGNTKAFTAVVMLQLEAEGKLSLDDTLDKHLPGAVSANGNDGIKFTLRHLLNQTSGLPDYAATQDFATTYELNLDPTHTWTPKQLVDLATTQPPVGAPGEKFHYANTNYVLAGMVIEKVTGNTVAAEITTRIITPLGLTGTTFPTTDPQLSGNFLDGHSITWGIYRQVTASQVTSHGAAGALVSSLDDLAKFERALIRGDLLPARQQQALKTTVPIKDRVGYGLGILRVDTASGPVWQHTGTTLGYFTFFLTSEDGEKQIIMAANEFHPHLPTPAQNTLGQAAMDAYNAL